MNAQSIVEEEVGIGTPDGRADAVFYFWPEGQRPRVIFLPDGIGTRPSQRQMARRLAGEGYNVLLPNIYYRSGREPFFPPKPDFTDERVKTRFAELSGPLSPAAMERDASAYVDDLASRPEVSAGPMGIVGFCFSGAFSLRAGAARPDKIAAAASFHGGGLFKEDPASPHLVLPRVTARLYFGHARDDRGMPAAAIEKFESALTEWGDRYESKSYDALHGWTVPDSAAYDEPEAERAFAALREFFATTLR